MTKWTQAALAYEAHIAELEEARAQYELAANDTLERLQGLISARLPGREVPSDGARELGKAVLRAAIRVEDVVVAEIRAWLSGAHGGPPATLAVGVLAEPPRTPSLGVPAVELRRAVNQRIGCQEPDLNAGDLSPEEARRLLVVSRIPLQEDAVTSGAEAFVSWMDGRLAAVIREQAPIPWATYGGIRDAVGELLKEGALQKATLDPRSWAGMAYVEVQLSRGVVWLSVRPNGQMVFSTSDAAWPVDDKILTLAGVEASLVGGKYPSVGFPRPLTEEAARRDAREKSLRVLRAHQR